MRKASPKRRAMLIFAALALFVVPLVWAVSRPPRIEEINRQTDSSNDTLEIVGRNFGDTRGQSAIIIGNQILTASNYLEWSNRRIRVRYGDQSGLVYVRAERTTSNGILFVNSDLLPRIVLPDDSGQAPIIHETEAPVVAIGRVLTIHGRRFGTNRNTSDVLFSWGSEQGEQGRVVPTDLEYLQWSERLIRVHVPDGAQSGTLIITTDWGSSEPHFIEIDSPVGGKIFDMQRSLAISYGVVIDEIRLPDGVRADNDLYLWVPEVHNLPHQRNAQILRTTHQPLFTNVAGATVFRLVDLAADQSYVVETVQLLDRYRIRGNISANRVGSNYLLPSEFMARYTSPSLLLPSDHDIIVAVANREARGNPYRRARALYDYVLRLLDPLTPDELARAEERIDPLTAYDIERGDAFGYSTLFTSLLRATNTPARVVAGYIIPADGAAVPHFWSEFYIQDAGWIPADPAMGDRLYPTPAEAQTLATEASSTQALDARATEARALDAQPLDAAEFYFGNLDGQRITFSRGYQNVPRLNPDSRTTAAPTSYALLSHNEEVVGNLEGYRSLWYDVRIIGEFR